MCFVKHLSVDAACEAVQQMAPYVASGDVIGLGADSTEKNNHPSKFAPVYDLARQVGFPRLTMHSGEEGPASWVRSTVFDLGIKRVDHAVHAADDEKLLDDLVKLGGVMFTVCPLSNVRLRVHKSVSESPIPLFLKKGIPFSINSDDPSYFVRFHSPLPLLFALLTLSSPHRAASSSTTTSPSRTLSPSLPRPGRRSSATVSRVRGAAKSARRSSRRSSHR